MLDPRLGFSVEELKSLHHKELGQATMYVVDGDDCKNLYVIQRFKKGICGCRVTLGLFIAKMDKT